MPTLSVVGIPDTWPLLLLPWHFLPLTWHFLSLTWHFLPLTWHFLSLPWHFLLLVWHFQSLTWQIRAPVPGQLGEAGKEASSLPSFGRHWVSTAVPGVGEVMW